MNLAQKPPMGIKNRDLPKRFSAAERRYFAWLAQFSCCLTGRTDIQIAHTGGIAEGKGMSRKAAIFTCLPIAAPLHWAEEAARDAFWTGVGIDPLPWAARLYDIYEKGGNRGEAEDLIADMQDLSDRAFLAGLLGRAA